MDAATLAQLLRVDLLPEAWIAPPETRELRALLRHRASLVRLATSLKNRTHAVLADRGIGERSGLWTAPGRAWLAGLDLPPTPRAIMRDCCGLLDALATRSPAWKGKSPRWPGPTDGSKRSRPCPALAGSRR